MKFKHQLIRRQLEIKQFNFEVNFLDHCRDIRKNEKKGILVTIIKFTVVVSLNLSRINHYDLFYYFSIFL